MIGWFKRIRWELETHFQIMQTIERQADAWKGYTIDHAGKLTDHLVRIQQLEKQVENLTKQVLYLEELSDNVGVLEKLLAKQDDRILRMEGQMP
jgi:hypothetical protein